ncbi:transcription factor UNE10-like [Sesamum indicum]|uniref:Transcription factor UNE10-like n=1 Tax=Sesamum indicum TaxID=4182 RepID=A0A8M8UUL4_SESIN|nr:transcription factor UNE10-like [Sesamum indicum]
MNQCVPSWNFDHNSPPVPTLNLHAHSIDCAPPHVPSLECEVAELTWENGQLTMHDLRTPRVIDKLTRTSSLTKYNTWDKPCAGGTLESIVNQATRHPHPKSAVDGGVNTNNDLVPWFDHHVALVNPTASPSTAVTMDALVPCNNNIHIKDHNQEKLLQVLNPAPGEIGACKVECSTCVGSYGGDGGAHLEADAPMSSMGINSFRTNGSVSKSATCGGRDSCLISLNTCGGSTCPKETISGKECSKASGDAHDSVSHSRSQARDSHPIFKIRQTGDEEAKNKGNEKSSVSTKRSRAADVHNQSERKRRDKINQRMKTLQKLVPNSSKTDKASMLDEVIEYLRQLQAQVQMMGRINISSMMLPLAMQQQLQMSMMPHMGMGIGMGMGMAGVMDMNAISHANGMPPVIPPTHPFMPLPSGDRMSAPTGSTFPDPLSVFLACQSQPMAMDAYSRLAALYQQMQQPPVGSAGSGSGSGSASGLGPKS